MMMQNCNHFVVSCMACVRMQSINYKSYMSITSLLEKSLDIENEFFIGHGETVR